jgi:hypothetical protein
MHFHIASSGGFVENQISAEEAGCRSIGSQWIAVSSGRPNSLYINYWHCEASSWLKSFRQYTSLCEVMFTSFMWIPFFHFIWIKFRIQTNWIPWTFLFLTMFPPRQDPAREWMSARRLLWRRARPWLHRIVSFGRRSEIDECAWRTTEEAGSDCPLQRGSEAQRVRNEKTPNERTTDQWLEWRSEYPFGRLKFPLSSSAEIPNQKTTRLNKKRQNHWDFSEFKDAIATEVNNDMHMCSSIASQTSDPWKDQTRSYQHCQPWKAVQ